MTPKVLVLLRGELRKGSCTRSCTTSSWASNVTKWKEYFREIHGLWQYAPTRHRTCYRDFNTARSIHSGHHFVGKVAEAHFRLESVLARLRQGVWRHTLELDTPPNKEKPQGDNPFGHYSLKEAQLSTNGAIRCNNAALWTQRYVGGRDIFLDSSC